MPGAEAYTGVTQQSIAPLGAAPTPTTVPPEDAATPESPQTTTTTTPPPSDASQPAAGRRSVVPIALGGLVVLLAVLGLGPGTRLVRRTARRRPDRAPAERVEDAWADVVAHQAWAGVRPRRSDTPAALAARAAPILEPTTAAGVARLADRVGAVRYGGGAAAVDAAHADDAADVADAVDRDITHRLPVRRRVRRWLDPRQAGPSGRGGRPGRVVERTVSGRA
jgi:hypothetical protein